MAFVVGVPVAFVAKSPPLISQARTKGHHGHGHNHDVIAITPPPQLTRDARRDARAAPKRACALRQRPFFLVAGTRQTPRR